MYFWSGMDEEGKTNFMGTFFSVSVSTNKDGGVEGVSMAISLLSNYLLHFFGYMRKTFPSNYQEVHLLSFLFET